MGLVKNVGIDPTGDGHILVSQGFADVHQRNAGAVGQAGEGMAQAMDRDGRQAVPKDQVTILGCLGSPLSSVST